MMTLYGFGPTKDSPDYSPFVIKVMTLLRMAGLDYVDKRRLPGGSPKGKLPYLDDNGVRIEDSTFIRFHLERAYGIDFNTGLSPEQRAQSWAIEKLCEDHLYWIGLYVRWIIDDNFERGAARLFDPLPSPLRPFLKWMVRRRMKNHLWAQGTGRHTVDEITDLGARDIEALSALLGEKAFLFGDSPCAADASAFAFLSANTAAISEFPVREAILRSENLCAYHDRMMKSYFPDFPTAEIRE